MSDTHHPPDELPDHLNPLATMRAGGFDAYIDEARAVLPDDWETRYGHSPRVLAYGLTYYVAFQDYTQAEVARAYEVPGASVRAPYYTLKDDLGFPPDND